MTLVQEALDAASERSSADWAHSTFELQLRPDAVASSRPCLALLVAQQKKDRRNPPREIAALVPKQ